MLIGALLWPATSASTNALIQGGLLSESELTTLRAAAERAGFAEDAPQSDRGSS